MDKNELETYQVQLSQVELALESEPDSAELKSLRAELKELIDLTTSVIAQSASAAESVKKSVSTLKVASTKSFGAGDDCLAKYSNDGNFYPARITSVGGSAENRVYSIVFKGYNTTEMVKDGDVKPLPPSYQQQASSHSSGPGDSRKRPLTKDDEDREKRKKKNDRKLEVRAAKAKEQNEKQASWQKFAKKSEKKGVHIAGVAGTSIFKTPDNPHGKVGVTGSGKGMTENASRPKNKFAVTDDT